MYFYCTDYTDLRTIIENELWPLLILFICLKCLLKTKQTKKMLKWSGHGVIRLHENMKNMIACLCCVLLVPTEFSPGLWSNSPSLLDFVPEVCMCPVISFFETRSQNTAHCHRNYGSYQCLTSETEDMDKKTVASTPRRNSRSTINYFLGQDEQN